MMFKEIFGKQFIENVINASEDTIFVFNPQTGKAIIWNKAFSEISGYNDDEIKSLKAPDSYYSEEDLKKAEAASSEVLESGKTTLEMTLITKNGRKIPYEYTGTTLQDSDGSILIVSLGRNITERKEIEKKLRESEEKYRSLFENMNAGFAYHEVIVDNNNKPIDYKYLEVNPIFVKLTGLKKENLIGKNVTEAIPGTENDPADWIGRFGNVGLTGIPLTIEEYSEAIKKWFKVSGYSPKKGYFAVTFTDITDIKIAEQKLKESEIIFRDLYEEAPNAYFSIGKDKSIIRCNNAAERLLGYTKDELLKMKIFNLYFENEYGLERAKKVFKQFLEGESIKDVELQMKNKNGDPLWVSLSVKPIIDPEGNVIESRSMVLDINERKLAQDKLEKSYEQLREMEYIINNSPGVVFLWQNSEGWPVEFVSENVKQFGYTPEEFHSGKVIYNDIIHPDDVERVNEEVNRYSNEGVNDFSQDYRIITKSGKVKWLDDRTWIRKNSEGKITHFQGIVLDITDRKSTEEALKLSEKNYKEAYDKANFYKDLFTHDMNNILQIINSSAELISSQLVDSEKSKYIGNMTNLIMNQVDRGSKLISNVRTLSELEEEEVTTNQIEISAFLENSINFIKKAYNKRHITISSDSIEETILTNANELLEDVFENILINAIKYNENLQVEISIKISKQKIDTRNYIRIEFIDNGIGIADHRKEVIFKRGHRELKGSKGMGLGLSLVSKILSIFNGKIWVEDRVKGDYTKGSNFIILLPIIN